MKLSAKLQTPSAKFCESGRMEELQDAIEDAQYVNAISTQEDGPRPVLAWEIPTEEQLAPWKTKVKAKDPSAYSLEWTLESPIGMFLFSSFLKENCGDHVRINFCEEVIRWRRLRGRQRVDKAKRIINAYLKGPFISLPAKTEIDEYDLERKHIKFDDIETLLTQNYVPNSDKCCVGLDGPARDAIFEGMRNVEEARAAYKRDREKLKAESASESATDPAEPAATPALEEAREEAFSGTGNGETIQGEDDSEERKDVFKAPKLDTSPVDDISKDLSFSRHSSQFRMVTKKPDVGPRYLPDDFFDKAEAIVMDTIREQYWEAFVESEQYTKLMHFLWYQDRRVVPEDFFVMRVLGRGGFGLVTGKVSVCDNLDVLRFDV